MIGFARKRDKVLTIALLVGCSLGAPACNEQRGEERAREALEKMQNAIPNRMAIALAQDATPEEIKQAQQSLTVLKEYMGEINGELDTVTINAIQAFQRAQGLKDDGLLDAKTMKLLAEAGKG